VNQGHLPSWVKFSRIFFNFTRRPHYAEEFENGGVTLKTRQMFFFRTTPGEFKNAKITSHGFVFEKNSIREITRLS